MVSTSIWKPLSLLDVVVGVAIVASSVVELRIAADWYDLVSFSVGLLAGATLMYSLVLALASLMFWKTDFLFTWLLRPMVQLARFPVSLYPSGVRLLLTWVVPVGFLTTVPAEMLIGRTSPGMVAISVSVAVGAAGLSAFIFRIGLRRYSSASS